MTHDRKLALPVALCLSLASLSLGSCTRVECENGTQEVFDKTSGRTTCMVSPSKVGVQCDLTTSRIEAGLCRGDPTKFPSCGSGTRFDEKSNSCVSTGGTAKTCDANQMPGKFCIQGSIRYFKDETSTRGKTLVVNAYDPIKFLGGPDDPTALLQTLTTDDGSYAFNNLSDPGAGIVAIGNFDPARTEFVLTGAGVNNVQGGNKYTVDIYAIEKTLVTSWETQAGIPAGMLLAKGGYVARFLDRLDESQANRTVGVTLNLGNAKAPDQFFFKDNLLTISKTSVATDGTGAILHMVPDSNLTTYTGVGGPCGGMVTWETVPGTSAPGVIFVQKFHPMP